MALRYAGYPDHGHKVQITNAHFGACCSAGLGVFRNTAKMSVVSVSKSYMRPVQRHIDNQATGEEPITQKVADLPERPLEDPSTLIPRWIY